MVTRRLGKPHPEQARIGTLWAGPVRVRVACVDEFLDRIGGLDGELGQGGAGGSGGQKQRLCIARTLLKHPSVLIFDDSTSAVDMATDAKIREHIARISDTTVLIIAQRIASVMDADRIVVLDDGRVHGVGTHEELLAGDNIYQEIYASQMEFAGNADTGDGCDDGCANDPFSSVPKGSVRKEGLSRVDGTAPLASACAKWLVSNPGRSPDPGPAGPAAPPGTGAAARR